MLKWRIKKCEHIKIIKTNKVTEKVKHKNWEGKVRG